MTERIRSGKESIANHCAELTGQLRAFADRIVADERRGVAHALDSIDRVAELQVELGRIDALLRGHARGPSRPRHLPSALERIARVRGTSVQAAVAEATEPVEATESSVANLLTSAQELELWMQRSQDDRLPASPPVDDAESDEPTATAPPVETVEPAGLLEALLGSVRCRAMIQGTTDTMPIATLFSFLADTRQTGCLHLRRCDEHLRFAFADGIVVATATSRVESEKLLGQLLIARQLLTPERLRELLAIARQRRQPLGAVAIAERDVTIGQITETLADQVQARFDRAFQDGRVAYCFVSTPPDQYDGRVRVNARWLLFEGARRADESMSPRGKRATSTT